MEVQFTPEQERQLAQVASKAGTSPEDLVRSAVLDLLYENKAQSAKVSELPSFNLGEVKPLHRRDIYDDVD